MSTIRIRRKNSKRLRREGPPSHSEALKALRAVERQQREQIVKSLFQPPAALSY